MRSTDLRILGIDPGTNILGFGIIDIRGKELRIVESGVLTLLHLDSGPEKLRRIFDRTRELIVRHRPDELAIEAPFQGKNVQSMLKLGRAQGVSIAAAIAEGVAYTEYAPRRVKQAVTGKGGATKEQVASMLDHILGFPVREQVPIDASDALGVAVCHWFSISGGAPSGGNTHSWSAFLKQNPSRLIR